MEIILSMCSLFFCDGKRNYRKNDLIKKARIKDHQSGKKKQSRREMIIHEAYWSCGFLRNHLNKPIRSNLSGDLNHDAEMKLSNILENPEGKAVT